MAISYTAQTRTLDLIHDVARWYQGNTKPLTSYKKLTKYVLSCDAEFLEKNFDDFWLLYSDDLFQMMSKALIDVSIKRFWCKSV